MQPQNILQALYDSEINCRIESFWDGGWIGWLGDEQNGFTLIMCEAGPSLNVPDTWPTKLAPSTQPVISPSAIRLRRRPPSPRHQFSCHLATSIRPADDDSTCARQGQSTLSMWDVAAQASAKWSWRFSLIVFRSGRGAAIGEGDSQNILDATDRVFIPQPLGGVTSAQRNASGAVVTEGADLVDTEGLRPTPGTTSRP